MQLEIKNFQSIHEAVIDIDGFTVITGASNRGKSALIRAVEALFFNEGGNEVIQKGCATTTVQLTEPPHKVMFWQRSDNGQVSLVLNDQKHTRVARDYLSLVAPFGYKEIETKNKSFRPQVATQHEGPFLLTVSPNTVAEVLQVVGHVDTVNTAQRLCVTDRKQHKTTLDIRKKDLEAVELKLESFENFTLLLDDLARATFDTHEVKNKSLNYHKMIQSVGFIQELQQLDDVPGECGLDKAVHRFLDLRQTLLEFINLQQMDVEVPDQTILKFPDEQLKLVEKLELFLKVQRVLLQKKVELLEINIEGQQIKEELLELEAELKVCPECKRPYEEK